MTVLLAIDGSPHSEAAITTVAPSADLIVVGSRGHGRQAGLALGRSTKPSALRTSYSARCPPSSPRSQVCALPQSYLPSVD